MNVYLRLLRFAKPYKLYILISLLSSVLYVFTNGVSLWIIGSLLSSIMNPEAITLGGIDSFTNKVNNYVFQYIDLCFYLLVYYKLVNVHLLSKHFCIHDIFDLDHMAYLLFSFAMLLF